MAEQSKHVQPPLIDPLWLFRLGERSIEGWSRGIGVLTTEMAGFALARMQENARAWSAIMTGANANTLFDLPKEFVRKAATDYLDEAGKLTRIVTQIASDSFPKPPQAPAADEQIRRAAE